MKFFMVTFCLASIVFVALNATPADIVNARQTVALFLIAAGIWWKA